MRERFVRIRSAKLRTGFAPFRSRYNKAVDKVVQVFASHAEADEANARFDASLTPEERINIVIELRDRRHPDAAKQGLARVCRVTELERS